MGTEMKKIVCIILVLWFSIVCVFVFKQEFTLQTGREVLLKTIPVDPRDLLRGDYVILNYEIAQIPHRFCKYDKNQTVYVTLNVDEQNIAHFGDISTKKPKTLFLKGRTEDCRFVTFSSENEQCVSFGIESFFVKEGTGKYLEMLLQNGALVRVLIDKNGNAKVIGFVIK